MGAQAHGADYNFDEADDAPVDKEEERRRAEEEELARVLELSKQDKGGRNRPVDHGSSSGGAGSSHAAAAAGIAAAAAAAGSSRPAAAPHSQYNGPSAHDYELMNPPPQAAPAYGAAPQGSAYGQAAAGGYQAPEPVDANAPLDINTATRVRALYNFTSEGVGELSFERGDVIKVLDRGFQEWWRGASNGKIGIFPVIYVEPLPEPTTRELQEEAQEEARVFASLGLVDQLLQTLKGIDPSRGDRIEDNPEVQEMYQASVALQGQINALIKKYSDQKAELEHMNANFLRAMQQYEELKGGCESRGLAKRGRVCEHHCMTIMTNEASRAVHGPASPHPLSAADPSPRPTIPAASVRPAAPSSVRRHARRPAAAAVRLRGVHDRLAGRHAHRATAVPRARPAPVPASASGAWAAGNVLPEPAQLDEHQPPCRCAGCARLCPRLAAEADLGT